MVASYPGAALRGAALALRVLAASAHRHRCVGTLAYRAAVQHLRGRAKPVPVAGVRKRTDESLAPG